MSLQRDIGHLIHLVAATVVLNRETQYALKQLATLFGLHNRIE